MGREQRLYLIEKYRRDPFVSSAGAALKLWKEASSFLFVFLLVARRVVTMLSIYCHFELVSDDIIIYGALYW